MTSDGMGSAEIRHMLKKHVLLSSIHGLAQIVTCTECRRTGPDTSANIVHSPKCRYAALMNALGEDVRTGSKSASSIKNTQITGAANDQGDIHKQKAKPHDPVQAALECTS